MRNRILLLKISTLDAEEPGQTGTPTRPLFSMSVPAGQPEKVIRTGKGNQKEKEREGRKRKTQKILMINDQYTINHLCRRNFGYVLFIVP